MATFKPLWTDGIHYVRAATPKDRHPMRFVVGAHKVTASDYKRHAETEAAAIQHAAAATVSWLMKNPADRPYHTLPEATGNSATPKPLARQSRKVEKPVIIPFSTHAFDCIIANPYAQVWQCSALSKERAPVGRPRADGDEPHQAPLFHEIGECAVMIGDQVIRERDGTPRRYRNWAEAEEAATSRYREAVERDEAISWKEGDIRVGATINVDILFDPETYGVKKPFILWFPKYGKAVYEDRTKSMIKSNPPSKAATEDNPQLKLDYDKALARARELEVRVPSFEERPLQFKSIWEAYREAERRERMLRGETVR